MGWEGEREGTDGAWVSGEERGEEREVGRRGDHGEAEAAGGELGGEV